MSDFADAVDILRGGGVVVIPTDTVYGMACLPRLADAVQEIFRLKGRAEDKPLPVLGDGVGDLETVAEFDDRARALARTYWPGPLTLVLPRAKGFDYDLGGDDRSTVGVRVPQDGLTLELLGTTGPLAVTSANRSGEPPAATAEQAREIFGDSVPVYLDGGPGGGEPSTVVSLVGPPKVIRDGAITYGELMSSLPA